MALHGDIALLTRSQDTETAVQQLKQQHPQVADVTALSVANDSDIARTIASASIGTQQTFDAVVCYNDAIEQLSTDLSAVLPLLKADGVLELHVANVSADDDEKKNAILMALMIGGFVDTSFGSSAASRVVYPDFATAVCCVATKQSLESAVMPLGKKEKPTPMEAARAPAIRKWTVLADDFKQDQEDDMVDEDTLLDDTEEVLLAAKAECGEAGGTKKRACKNCTCG